MSEATGPYILELQQRNIAPSYQRIMILKYLAENQNHPTADQIYGALRVSIPTLSKATVYNTLNLFAEFGLVRILSVEDNETRYDVVVQNHGHFKCSSCGSITNFAVNIDRFVTEDLQGFQITQKNVYFNGRCPNCLAKAEE